MLHHDYAIAYLDIQLENFALFIFGITSQPGDS